MRLPRSVVLLALAVSPSVDLAEERIPVGRSIPKLEARPEDVTRLAKLDVPPVVKATRAGLVRPVSDGGGTIRVTVADKALSVPIAVSGQKERYNASFVRDVMPALSKLGCNAGTCHGSLDGKNGFKLSLRGYDPLYDHRALTDELEARRVNRAAPDRSLMLMKPAGAVPHVGGVVWQPGDPYYELVKLWIAEGVKLDLNSPRVASLEVSPKDPVMPAVGSKQQFAV